jgi:4-hydroxybenzoate polyprenyltransferase
MAFAAVQGTVPPLAWLLFLANLLWTTGYDTWYAMVDREDHLRVGAKSTAILFGDMDLVAQAVLYGSFLVTMLLLGGRAGLGFVYMASLGVAAGFIAWQFAVARDRRPENCFRAFLGNQWVGFVVFLGIALDLASR